MLWALSDIIPHEMLCITFHADFHTGSLRVLRRSGEWIKPVLLVHHARKDGHRRGGQALRGSTEIHAWADSLLYLKRRGSRRILLNTEHRGLPSGPELALELRAHPPELALHVDDAEAAAEQPPADTPRQRIEAVLAKAKAPMPQRELRSRAGIRAEAVVQALKQLVDEGRVERTPNGCWIAS